MPFYTELAIVDNFSKHTRSTQFYTTTDIQGNGILHHGFEHIEDPAIMRKLLSNKRIITYLRETNADEFTPLQLAAKANNTEAIDYFLEESYKNLYQNKNAKDIFHDENDIENLILQETKHGTAIHVALESQHLNVAEDLYKFANEPLCLKDNLAETLGKATDAKQRTIFHSFAIHDPEFFSDNIIKDIPEDERKSHPAFTLKDRFGFTAADYKEIHNQRHQDQQKTTLLPKPTLDSLFLNLKQDLISSSPTTSQKLSDSSSPPSPMAQLIHDPRFSKTSLAIAETMLDATTLCSVLNESIEGRPLHQSLDPLEMYTFAKKHSGTAAFLTLFNEYQNKGIGLQAAKENSHQYLNSLLENLTETLSPHFFVSHTDSVLNHIQTEDTLNSIRDGMKTHPKLFQEIITHKTKDGNNIVHILSNNTTPMQLRTLDCIASHHSSDLSQLLTQENNEGQTPLHLEIDSSNMTLVDYIISLANKPSNQHLLPTLLSALPSRQLETLKTHSPTVNVYIQEHPEFQDADGQTTLHRMQTNNAASRLNDVSKQKGKLRATLLTKDSNGNTPLDLALQTENDTIVEDILTQLITKKEKDKGRKAQKAVSDFTKKGLKVFTQDRTSLLFDCIAALKPESLLKFKQNHSTDWETHVTKKQHKIAKINPELSHEIDKLNNPLLFRDKEGKTPLGLALQNSDTSTVNKIIKQLAEKKEMGKRKNIFSKKTKQVSGKSSALVDVLTALEPKELLKLKESYPKIWNSTIEEKLPNIASLNPRLILESDLISGETLLLSKGTDPMPEAIMQNKSSRVWKQDANGNTLFHSIAHTK